MDKPKKFLPWLIPLICVAGIGMSVFKAVRSSPEGEYRMKDFAELPVVANGRTQPLDSIARNSLMMIHGKQRLKVEAAEGEGDESRRLSAIEWLAEVMFDSSAADSRKLFVIHHDDVLNLIGHTQADGKLYSFAQIEPSVAKLDEESHRISDKDSKLWTVYEKGVMKLRQDVSRYIQLKHSLNIPGTDHMESELQLYLTRVSRGLEEIDKRTRGEEFDEALIAETASLVRPYFLLTQNAFFFPLPTDEKLEDTGQKRWLKMGDAMVFAIDSGEFAPMVTYYARMGDGYRGEGPEAVMKFNTALTDAQNWLEANHEKDFRKTRAEAFFYRLAPFYVCMVVYVVAFLCALFFWLTRSETLARSAFLVLMVAFVLHTAGLIFRMVLEGRPPVTNLYSSAVFIGWGAVLLSAFIEKIYRNGIGAAVAGVIGFATLLVAHHLSISGDTLEMMRAVLDSNFWLATHVVVITLGYSATFLAGFLAIAYIIIRLTGKLGKSTATELRGMVYGIICFATLFSFVGTILGGIWADQSWGRFWGWDPKENGALLIVIWNAIILHARWGGMVRERGMMVMAVFGNIVTSWSWFGTNMLGVGLHSYGFMDAAFFWLIGFMISQIIIMALGLIPVSQQKTVTAKSASPEPERKTRAVSVAD